MSEIRVKFIIIYCIAVLAAIAAKAIKEEKLTTGIYVLYPIEGKKAVELAKGYIRTAKIAFWFVVLFFPFI